MPYDKLAWKSTNDSYALKSVTECNGQIFVFLISESELKSKTRATTTAAAA
jgi:hypothetical protein